MPYPEALIKSSNLKKLIGEVIFFPLVPISFFIKASEDTPQLAAGLNRRAGWQAAYFFIGAAKRVRARKV